MAKKPKKRCRNCELAKPAFLKLTNAYVAEQIKNQNLEEECKSLSLRNGIQQGVIQAACANADADELMLAKQRERLIRLTEICYTALSLVGALELSDQNKTITSNLFGKTWITAPTWCLSFNLAKEVKREWIALEVDTALGLPKEKR